MATAPPPFSPRDAARQAKAYARMQRDQARLQRAQYRAQYAYLRRRPSFVGPLLLIGLGVIALLLETGRLSASAFWPWYARWWPVLLIFIGVGLLAEYFLDRNNPMAGRRSVGGIVWLIVLFSLIGGGSHFAPFLGPWAGHVSDHFDDHDGWMAFLGEQHVETHTLVHPITPGSSLTIEDARGDVQVEPAASPSPNEVRVEVRQEVHANSDAAARRDFEATLPVFGGVGSVVLTAPGRDGASADLKVTVPADIVLIVRTNHGDVTLSGLTRNVEASDSHGDVTIDNIAGGVHIQMDHGDVIAHNITGDLSIDGKADDISVAQVKGKTLLNGDFFGDTRLEGIGSEVKFHSSRTDLDVPKLDGELTLDSGDLRIVNPSGGLRLTTRSKDVEVTGLVGEAYIEDNNGDVNVTAGLPLGNLVVTDHTGAITVTVPSNASFTVHGSTGGDDEVTSEFPLSNQSSDGRKELSGQVGQGGPRLVLSTDHGDLTLHRGGANVAERPEAPEKPERPEKPDRPARHLNPTDGETPQPTVQ